MSRTQRDFAARSSEEREWMLHNTWCDACGEADLGINSPREYEENGRVYVEGECRKCGQGVRSEVIDRMLANKPLQPTSGGPTIACERSRRSFEYAKLIPAGRRWLRPALIVLGGAAAVALIIVVAGGVLIWHMLSGPEVNLLAFDPVNWKAASAPDSTHNSVRLRMADSFLADELPVGKSRDQIVALLGEPDDTPYFRNYDMVYYLGPERGLMGIDSEWLVLKLTNGKVTEAHLVTD